MDANEALALAGYHFSLHWACWRAVAARAAAEVVVAAAAACLHAQAIQSCLVTSLRLAHLMGEKLSLCTIGSAMNLPGLVLDKLVGSSQWEYMASFDPDAQAGVLHRLLWGDRCGTYRGYADAASEWQGVPGTAFLTLVTLRCQPWCFLNVHRDKFVWAALRELIAIHKEVAGRLPPMMVHEVPSYARAASNPFASAWEMAESALENIYRAEGYVWVTVHTDPARQRATALSSRSRLLYVAVRRDVALRAMSKRSPPAVHFVDASTGLDSDLMDEAAQIWRAIQERAALQRGTRVDQGP